MSEDSTPVPILSYKKPLVRAPSAVTPNNSTYLQLPHGSSAVASPIVSAPESPMLGSTPTLGATPTLGGTRKVSSRRKALQEFYKLQESEKLSSPNNETTEPQNQPENSQQQENSHGIGIIFNGLDANSHVDIESLGDAAELNKYIKTATVEDMLKLRNQAANKLNHHDVERKSIIYDNYYELIKLSQVLSNLDVASAKTSSLDMDAKPKVTDQYVNKVLGELTDFLAGEGAVFNQDFEEVAESIRRGMDDSDSAASMRGIASETD